MNAHHRSGLGPFVVLVGPDGVGKTSVARAIVERFEGPTAYVHFRPPWRGSLPVGPPPEPGLPPPKKRASGAVAAGWIRILRSAALFWIGYWRTVRRYRQSGALVVADRWIYGYIAQPRALGFFGPQWLARLAVKSVPRPDLVANLTADPAIIYARKQELSLSEIREELAAWAALGERRAKEYRTEADSAAIANAILGEIVR